MALTLSQLIWITVGGALGAVLRFWLTRLTAWVTGHSLPATLAVNGVGCLGLGLVFSQSQHFDQGWLLVFELGVFGGFTTFSTFAVEVRGLLHDRPRYAGAYLVLSVLLTMASFLLGRWLGGGM